MQSVGWTDNSVPEIIRADKSVIKSETIVKEEPITMAQLCHKDIALPIADSSEKDKFCLYYIQK